MNKSSLNHSIAIWGLVLVAVVFPILIPALIIYYAVYNMGEFTLTFNDQTKCVEKKKHLGTKGSFSISYDKAKDFVVEEWLWDLELGIGGSKTTQKGGHLLLELEDGQTFHVGTSMYSSRAQLVAKSMKEVLNKKKE